MEGTHFKASAPLWLPPRRRRRRREGTWALADLRGSEAPLLLWRAVSTAPNLAARASPPSPANTGQTLRQGGSQQFSLRSHTWFRLLGLAPPAVSRQRPATCHLPPATADDGPSRLTLGAARCTGLPAGTGRGPASAHTPGPRAHTGRRKNFVWFHGDKTKPRQRTRGLPGLPG